MAAVIVVGKELIRGVGKEADLKPYLLERYLPWNTAVFCIDAESAIRALDRGAPNATGANTIGTGLSLFAVLIPAPDVSGNRRG
jgi:hypothetical protein